MPVNLSYVPPVAAADQRQPSYMPPILATDQRQPSYTPPPVVMQRHPSYTPPQGGACAPPLQQSSYVPPPSPLVQPSSNPPAAVMHQPTMVAASPAQPASYVPPPMVFGMQQPQQPSYTPPPVAQKCEQHLSYTPLPEVLPGPLLQPQPQNRYETPRYDTPRARLQASAPAAAQAQQPLWQQPLILQSPQQPSWQQQQQPGGVSCQFLDGSSLNLPPIGMNLPPLFRPQMCALPPLSAGFQAHGFLGSTGMMKEFTSSAESVAASGTAMGWDRMQYQCQPPPMPRMPDQMQFAQ